MENTCTLTDEELIARCNILTNHIPTNLEGVWKLSPQPDHNNDPDILLQELIKRFAKSIK